MRVAPLSETDNPEDDKVYVFFTERAQEAEGAAGKVLYSRVARVCKVCLFALSARSLCKVAFSCRAERTYVIGRPAGVSLSQRCAASVSASCLCGHASSAYMFYVLVPELQNV